MRLLLHICCANCGLYPIKELKARGHRLTGLWYNPNIQPEDEYARRLGALRTLEGLWGLDIKYSDSHAPDVFMQAVEDHGGVRCEACYRLRLREAARAAKEAGADAFSTTLLVSPYQKHDLVVRAGREAGEEHSVPFHAEDFRAGYREGVAMSKALGLYRQKYCGCIFSKNERERAKHGRTVESRA